MNCSWMAGQLIPNLIVNIQQVRYPSNSFQDNWTSSSCLIVITDHSQTLKTPIEQTERRKHNVNYLKQFLISYCCALDIILIFYLRAPNQKSNKEK